MSLAVLNGFNTAFNTVQHGVWVQHGVCSTNGKAASLVEYRPYSASIIGAVPVVCCDPAVVVLKLVLELQ